MNRKRRTEILIRGDRKVSKMIAEEIKQLCEVKIVNEPDNGLVMIKMRECAKKQLFYLGEVLVTEANEADYIFVLDDLCNKKLGDIIGD